MIHPRRPDQLEHAVGVPLPQVLLAGVFRPEVAERRPGIGAPTGQGGRRREVDRESGELVHLDDHVLVRVGAVVDRGREPAGGVAAVVASIAVDDSAWKSEGCSSISTARLRSSRAESFWASLAIRLSIECRRCLGQVRRMMTEPRIVGHEVVGLLRLATGRPTGDPADGLAEEERRDGRGRMDGDPQAWDVDTLGDHPHGDHPGGVAAGVVGDHLGGPWIVGDGERRLLPRPPLEQVGDPPGVLLVHRDHEATGIGRLPSDRPQPFVGLHQHGGEPVALDG